MPWPELDKATQTELEAAAFRTLVKHLQDHPEVQNIDLMNLADFCRNCLSKWYRAAAEEKGLDLDYDEAREIVYGMPYSEWKANTRPKRHPSSLPRCRRSRATDPGRRAGMVAASPEETLIGPEAPSHPDSIWCLDRYFNEIDRRFPD